MTDSRRLVDTLGRVHNNLRISVTDRCNIRCFYCMPNENVQFKPRAEILTFEEIVRFTRVAASLGVDKVRLTGGEPLVRADLCDLVSELAAIPGIRDIAMTTNGVLLADHVVALKQAGLKRLNISLDGLREETFERISRRQGLDRVLEGIFAAQRIGFERIRLNAVAIRGITEDEIVPLGEFARQHNLELRFIEFMPLDAENNWCDDQVLSGSEIRDTLENEFGPLRLSERTDLSQPATDYRFEDGRGVIGFINPVTQPFCGSCNRLRITAEGKIRNCLFSIAEWDAREVMRSGGSDEQLVELLQDCILAKKPGHGIDSPDFIRPERAMYQIGG
ncbi:MAG: GTP 3',8-cyclase MoaA [Planctomycetaceae bacterium]|nr:GTP 3',8-cyclase MoaA [Planctomycetales bacterium]MCB9875503.1 GTP 3',8-cyclase MoaA [Planctomycetaceae bacterium]MCB9939987.1 GTP 3',8-cyclase MoaA [Planctomycetaceae bacterium]HRX80313.1 GTP 3',8-cyclase MoaA [Pirellulaceae bacterium]